MVRVDREVVRQRLERMLFELDAIDLKLPRTCDANAAEGNEDARYELEHRMYIALQAMLDVASHVAVAGNVRNLQTYRDAVDAMVTLGIVDDGLGEALAGAPGLRNALAHEYLNIDQQRVYAAMGRTGDLRVFAARVWEWVEGEAGV